MCHAFHAVVVVDGMRRNLDKVAVESNCAIAAGVHGLVQVVHRVVVLLYHKYVLCEQCIVRHLQTGQLCTQQAVVAAQFLMLPGTLRRKRKAAFWAFFQLHHCRLVHDASNAIKQVFRNLPPRNTQTAFVLKCNYNVQRHCTVTGPRWSRSVRVQG